MDLTLAILEPSTIERLNALLADWHEAGRAEFERTAPNLTYDTYSPKRLIIKRKYLYLDEGTCGVWLVDRATGEVYRIKSAYGVPDKRKCLGHIDTITGADLHRLRWWYR